MSCLICFMTAFNTHSWGIIATHEWVAMIPHEWVLKAVMKQIKQLIKTKQYGR